MNFKIARALIAYYMKVIVKSYIELSNNRYADISYIAGIDYLKQKSDLKLD